MDSITAVEPPLTTPGLPGGITTTNPANDTQIISLDLNQEPKVRTKLRLYAILLALYVLSPANRLHLSTG
jgi:hypothetical protein